MDHRTCADLWRRIEQGVHSRQLEHVMYEGTPIDPNVHNLLCAPAVLYRVVCFAGGVDTLGIATMVCRRMRLLLENALLWKFCVRYGRVPARLRPRWWAHCLRIPDVFSPNTYQQLVRKGSTGKFVMPIERDIRRSFRDHMKKPLYISSQLRQTYQSDNADAAASLGSAGSIGSLGALNDDERESNDSKDPEQEEMWPPISKSPHVALLERIIQTEGVHALPDQTRDSDLDSEQLLKFEATRSEMQQALARILLATAEARPHVGYCQGMNFVAVQVLHTLAETRALSTDEDDFDHDAFLLQFDMTSAPERQSLHLMSQVTMQGEEYSFWIFHEIITNLNLQLLYDPSMSQLPVYCYQFECLLSAFLPECHKHMLKRGVTSEMYLVSWFQTLFVYLDTLPVETIHRVWDIFMYEKTWKVLFRTALALIKVHERDILMANMEEIIQILVKLPRYNCLDPDELMNCAMSFKVTNSILSTIEQQFLQQQLQQQQQPQPQQTQGRNSPAARAGRRFRRQHLYNDRERQHSVVDRMMDRMAKLFAK